ncbi:hypothetical protein [Marinicella gelatinilytica]|uniref:hypothetical protein n=1 Tax=Marinicella gelatinilytica TaxID=2996017 RepID=UPI002260AD83|nr:hypothetical protein [Marinicella gelatinilytica]MCX7544567.1 hypothetical protein [Marinicella gelatinilytica]
MIKTVLLILIFSTLSFSSKALADNEAEQAAKDGLQAVTIFVDISRFSRKNRAAKKMTKLHREFAQFGYALLAVNVYTENGDLEGFFVSYQKRTTTPSLN